MNTYDVTITKLGGTSPLLPNAPKVNETETVRVEARDEWHAQTVAQAMKKTLRFQGERAEYEVRQVG